MKPTVVIPAHDEQEVIGRCLTTLLADVSPDDLRVVVVSNGSTDATVQRARDVVSAFPVEAEVLDLPRPSKIGAIREGVRRSSGAPVIVLDADVELPTSAAIAILEVLGRPGPVVASARLRVDTTRSSWWVRHYYRMWTALPYVEGSIGSGVFGLNAAALAVVGELPHVTNDDGWIMRRFPAGQRVVADCEFVAHAARTVRALIGRRARIINGNRELEGVGAPEPSQGFRELARALRARTAGPVDALVFLAVTGASRAVAAVRRARGSTDWSTDHTSRAPVPETVPTATRVRRSGKAV